MKRIDRTLFEKIHMNTETIVYDYVYKNPHDKYKCAIDIFKKTFDNGKEFLQQNFLSENEGVYSTKPFQYTLIGSYKSNKTSIGKCYYSNITPTEGHKKLFCKILNCNDILFNFNNCKYMLSNCLSFPIDINIYKQEEGSNDVWIAIIFITPFSPINSGVTIKRHKEFNINNTGNIPTENNIQDHIIKKLTKEYCDQSLWEDDIVVSNKFNRLLLIRKNLFFATTQQFGTSLEESRIVEMFEFSVV